jgi:ADP-ribosylglycohydrolase
MTHDPVPPLTAHRSPLTAVTLGDDTDTTGGVAGRLAGIVQGHGVLPGEWVGKRVKQGEGGAGFFWNE